MAMLNADDTPLTPHRYDASALLASGDELLDLRDLPRQGRLTAPLLHFRTGTTSRFRRELLRAFSDDRDYTRASQLVRTSAEPLTAFQANNFQWMLSVVREHSSDEYWRARTKAATLTPDDGAVYEENRVFGLIHAGDFSTARQRASGALEHHPTSHGLWVNLLVAMTGNEEHAAVETALLQLPRILDIDEGLLGVYLEREPRMLRPVCNGG
jgi:hypothetical protein